MPPPPMLGRETERRPLFCSFCPLHIAWAERHACALNGVRKKREGKGEEWGRMMWMARGKGRVHSWSCIMLSDRKREDRSKMWAPDMRGEAWSCQEWHIVWKRRGGSFPHFQLALSILPHLPAPNHPAHQPPPLVCPCQGCMWLADSQSVSLSPWWGPWLVGCCWSSRGQTLGLYPEEVSSLRSGFSDTGAIFYRDRIKPAQV